MTLTSPSKVAQTFSPVKSKVIIDTSHSPDSMTPHSTSQRKRIRGNRNKVWRETRYYGVSSDYRVLSKSLFIKHFDRIRDFLKWTLGLTAKQREVIFTLLRLWVHYGKCYPTVAMLCREAYCSKSTALRIIKELEHLGLIEVMSRDLQPYRRQISNLYLLHGLILLIARYLAEHGQAFYERWLRPYLTMPGREFWSQAFRGPGDRAGPGVLAF